MTLAELGDEHMGWVACQHTEKKKMWQMHGFLCSNAGDKLRAQSVVSQLRVWLTQ
jgi:hypothetical protein